MPLSEQEQRLLDEMERNLYRNDADFVATVSGQRGKPNYTWIVLGALMGVLGVGTILVGIATQLPIVGVIGFIVLFGGVLLALARPKASAGTHGADGPSSTHPARRAGFMDRMNERWDKRNEGNHH